ncbi:hypothetical protein LX36DRAFT_179892 [Colletotrichum falcatum]|nr:hypothetical protein LX36DRAFT_179892 [Colletotrichum falcatum]
MMAHTCKDAQHSAQQQMVFERGQQHRGIRHRYLQPPSQPGSHSQGCTCSQEPTGKGCMSARDEASSNKVRLDPFQVRAISNKSPAVSCINRP